MPPALAARVGAPAALVAAVCFVAYDLPHFALGTDVRASADSPLFAFHAIAGVAGLVALVLVIFALHGWIDDQKGARAPLGFGLALAGTVLAAGGAWGEAFVVPAVRESAAGAIERPEGMLIVGLLLTMTVFATGWVLLTLVLRRAGLLSTGAAVVVGVGAVASAMPLPGGVLLFIPGVLLLRARLAAQPAGARDLREGAVAGRMAA